MVSATRILSDLGYKEQSRFITGNIKTSSSDYIPLVNQIIFQKSGKVIPIDSRNAMANSAIWTCVRIISEAIAMMDRKVIKKDKSGNFDEIEDHYLLPLLNLRASPLYSSFSLTEAESQSVNLDGNSFTYIELKDDGTPERLTFIPREDVEDYEVDDMGNLWWNTTYGKIPDERIKHYKIIPKDGIWGLSPVSWHRQLLETGQSAARYASEFYEHGAFPGGILSVPGLLKQETREKVKAALKANKPGETLVLDGNTTYTTMQPLPGDVQWLSTIKEVDKRVAAIYRVPFHMVSSDAEMASYNSMEQFALEFKHLTIKPHARMMAMEETYKLLSTREIDAGFRIEFDYSTLELADMRTLGEWMSRMHTMGLMNNNDLRGKFLQKSTIPFGDAYLVQGNNMTTLEAAVKGEKPIESAKE